MGIRDNLLALFEQKQYIAGPGMYDSRPNRVFIVRRTWSGGEAYLGTLTETVTEILPVPRVGWTVEGREMSIEPVVPEHATGGMKISDINPADAPNAETIVRLVGPDAGDWILYNFEASRPYRWRLTVRALNRDYPRPVGS